MGNFYVNMTAKGPNQDEVLATLTKLGRKAFVFPTIRGLTTFCDAQAETQEPRLIEELARKASRDLGCPILCVLNHDDDVLWYGLYERGEVLDEYDSFPGYFEGHFNPPKGGDAASLCKLVGATNEETVVGVEAILRKPHNEDGYIFEVDRHTALVEAVGLPRFSVGAGYRYLERGELPDGLDRESLKQS
jgi:hypothetical protein